MTPSLLGRVHRTLAAAGIRSALIGAAALAIHGVSRATQDQDLLVTDGRALDPAVWASLPDVTADIRRGDADDPLAGVVRLTAAGERDVDVVVARGEWPVRILDDASVADLPEGPVPVVSAAGLVVLKLHAGGPQDFWDIEQLRAVLGSSLDAEVMRALDGLPAALRAAWDRIQRQRGAEG